MTVDIETVVTICIFLISLAGIIGAYFTMQTRQNMKLEQQEKKIDEVKLSHEKDIDGVRAALEKEIEELKRKQSLSTTNQIKTEKALEVLMTKMDRLLKDMDELKSTGCGRCHDGAV